MKKLVLVIISIIMCASASLRAQEAPVFGLRLGLDFRCPTAIDYEGMDYSAFKNGTGFEVTGVFNMPLMSGIYFEPGLGLYYNTFGIKTDFLKEGPVSDKTGGSVRQFGFRMPMMFGYHFDTYPMSFNLFFGPVIDIGIVGHSHHEVWINNEKYGHSDNAFGDDGFMNRCDVGVRIGGSTEFNDFILQLYGTIGTCNRISIDHAKMRTSNITLAIGYNF